MTALASIYERQGSLFVTASHQTVAGFWLIDDRVSRLDGPSVEELGRAIELALGRSQTDVPTPPRDASPGKPLLQAAGVGSWRKFMPMAKHVTVAGDVATLTIEPWRNAGAKAGFEPQPELAVALPTTTPAEVLGRAVLDCLARCD